MRRNLVAAWAVGCVTAAWVAGGMSVPQAHAASVTYQILTNELKAKQDGAEHEVYRFDPAVYVVNQGDDVTLQIRGFKGHDHPVLLEDYNLRTVVHRNQVTTLHFQASLPGFHRLVCTEHLDAQHEGPMEAYLVVIPSKS
ncbi:MAG: hypothetical protein K6T78_14995 [Alicyclobacillus sp.]|nr:hypothetical protein [Alicyclobacillus sp.]